MTARLLDVIFAGLCIYVTADTGGTNRCIYSQNRLVAHSSGRAYSSSERQNWSTIMKMYLFAKSLVVNGPNPYLDGLVHRVPLLDSGVMVLSMPVPLFR